jgi:hypothetical protein
LSNIPCYHFIWGGAGIGGFHDYNATLKYLKL